MIFSTLDTTLMVNCIELLAVVFMIGVIDSLPDVFKRKRKKKEEDEE